MSSRTTRELHNETLSEKIKIKNELKYYFLKWMNGLSWSVLFAEHPHDRCHCHRLSHTSVWWSQLGRFWIWPQSTQDSSALLRQSVHECHELSSHAQCDHRDQVPPEVDQGGSGEGPQWGHPLWILSTTNLNWKCSWDRWWSLHFHSPCSCLMGSCCF